MSTAIAKTNNTERFIEYIPQGSADKIKLNIDIVKKFIAIPTKSGAMPTDRDCIRFQMLCQAQRLNPFAGDAFLTGYDSKNGPAFSMITAHVAFIKRAESHADYEGMESGIIILNEDGTINEREGDFCLESENVVGGWAKVYRKGRKPTYRRLSIAQRKPNYETQFWQGAKAIEQIVKCAEADALRATFPTLLGGLMVAEEQPAIDISSAVVAAESPQLAGVVEASRTEPKAVEVSPQQQLAEIITSANFTFDQFRAWGIDQQHLTDSVGSFEEVPTDTAKRLIKAKVGLLSSLKAANPA